MTPGAWTRLARDDEVGWIYIHTIHFTGTDILFFWVARMVFLCSELTAPPSASAAVTPGCVGGPPPFRQVWLHPVWPQRVS